MLGYYGTEGIPSVFFVWCNLCVKWEEYLCYLPLAEVVGVSLIQHTCVCLRGVDNGLRNISHDRNLIASGKYAIELQSAPHDPIALAKCGGA